MNWVFGKGKLPRKELKENLVKDYIPEGAEGFKVNFTRLQKAVRDCQRNRENRECRIALKEIGVEFADE